ncbi:MFS transporter [Actinomycetospora sp. TBRC 11914]|uniref:MFS transporter n=1 Tax=Actinomycetospora sp. TBRC 11914 TaxID=2729387 RepID=UPI00145E6756|nr:MFS transporter [Actinomycetospora sp. TBRC 11914]NMO91444.1 MFS transporter [Actinomycetospora sp. TBRC 11914]
MAGSRPHPGRGPLAGAGALLLAVGLTAACLRSPVTAVGAVLGALRAPVASGGLGLGGLGAGVLTAMPLAVFAAGGIAAPAVTRRLGARAVVLGGLAVIAVALLARAASGSVTTLLATSAVALVAVSWINVVLPPLVAPRSPWATGVFSTGVLVGIAAPAALAVPVGSATGLGWRGGLGVWALLAVAAAASWAGTPVEAGPVATRRPAAVEGRRPVALAAFFGAQSLGAFAVMGWLPQVYRDAGLASGTASVLLAVTVVPALPAALLLPALVRRGHGTALVAGVGAAQVLGLAGLALAPARGAWLWAVLLTTAHWGFPLAMALVARRSAGDPTRLSAQVQGTGYALAVAGPLLLGPLHDASGAWILPLSLLLLVALGQVVAGLRVTLTDPGRAADTEPPTAPLVPAPVVGTPPEPTGPCAPTAPLPVRSPEDTA